MRKEDFKFITEESAKEYHDYWFKISGQTKEELTEKYMEQSMVEVSEVVYDSIGDGLGIRKMFPFNEYVSIIEDDDLKNVIKEIILKI